MKKHHGFSLIFLLPIVILVMVIGGVFVYKLYSDGNRAKATESPVVKVAPGLTTPAKKPQSGYGSLAVPVATATPIPTVGVSGKIDLDTLLSEPLDTGESEFSEIASSAAQL